MKGTMRSAQAGVTLIELMVSMTILMLALAWGLPSFSLWLQGAQVRTAAESIQNGMHLARTEAVKRNAVVRFSLTDNTGRVAWTVGCVTATADCPAEIQKRIAAEGTPNARVGASVAAVASPAPANAYSAALTAGAAVPAGVSFDGMGRVPAANVGTDITRVDVINAANTAARRLVVTINAFGLIRMCDPAVALSANPVGCS
jgi:type IV fimbrial biogenesis protein FimT